MSGAAHAIASPPLGSINHKALFGPNIIVEFAEDSPNFRRKVEALDRNVEGKSSTFSLAKPLAISVSGFHIKEA